MHRVWRADSQRFVVCATPERNKILSGITYVIKLDFQSNRKLFDLRFMSNGWIFLTSMVRKDQLKAWIVTMHHGMGIFGDWHYQEERIGRINICGTCYSFKSFFPCPVYQLYPPLRRVVTTPCLSCNNEKTFSPLKTENLDWKVHLVYRPRRMCFKVWFVQICPLFLMRWGCDSCGIDQTIT